MILAQLVLVMTGAAQGQTGCTYTVTPPAATVPAAATTLPLTVTTGGSCLWTVTNSNAWIDAPTGSRIGSGTITLQIARHDGAVARAGVITIANRNVTIQQAPCLYTVGGSGTLIFSHTGGPQDLFPEGNPGCLMTPVSPPWLSVLPSTHSSFHVATAQPNPTFLLREGAIVFPTGQSISVLQRARPCTITVPEAVFTPASSGSFSIPLTTSDPQCPWTLTAPSALTIEGGVLSTGTGVVLNGTGSTVVRGAMPATSVPVAHQITVSDRNGGFTGTRVMNVAVTASRTLFDAAGGDFQLSIGVACPSCVRGIGLTTWVENTGVPTGDVYPMRVVPNTSTVNRSFDLPVSLNGAQVASIGLTQLGVCNITRSPSTITVAADGGAVEFMMTAPDSRCPWTVTPSESFLRLNRSTGTGTAVITGTMDANPSSAPRTASAGIVSPGAPLVSVRMNQAGQECTPAVNPASASVPAAGGSRTFTVTIANGCPWQVSVVEPWLSLGGASSGTGNGSFTVNAGANTGASARNGTINVSGKSITLTQLGASCTYTLSPSAVSVAAAGGSRVFTVETGAGCNWQATTGDSWISLTGVTNGTGPGSFTANIATNAGSTTRSGTVGAGGQTASITQEGSPCNYTLSASSISVVAAGEQGSVTVSAAAGCNWTAVAAESWVVIQGGANGTGNGTVLFQVLANPGTGARSTTLTIAGRSYVVNQAGTGVGGSTAGLTFVSMAPCRILETRAEYNFEGRTGAFGPPALGRGETRTLAMNGSSLCPIPASAKAYVMNVTLVPRGGVEFATLWPAGQERPNVWSIRSPDGNIVANSAIIQAGAGGAIQLFVSDSTDLLIDVAGYFTDNPALSNLVYYPLTPCRVIETRSEYRAAGPFGPPSMGARQTRRFRFPGSPCAVPQGAAAYSMTITAVPQGALQYLTAWPAGATQPNVSSINSPAGRVLANSVILPASADGSIDVFTFDATDFLIDITGYFAPDDGMNGLYYYPVTQCRASDSTVSGGIFGDEAVRTLNVAGAAGCSGIPSSAKGYALNVTALPGGQPMPFVTVYPTGQSRPNASMLNAFNGQIVTNSSIVPAGAGGAVEIFAYRRTHLVVEINGYFGR